MPASKFKFVSPGVQIAEIDNSQLPALPGPVGPVIIGRTARGPGLRPVQVDSFSEFVEIFGNPQPGGLGTDVWRNGGSGLSPTYGAYAAQAYLRNSSPITFVRLLGKTHPDKTSATAGPQAGWSIGSFESELTVGAEGRTRGAIASQGLGGAYGLFVCTSGSNSATTKVISGTLAAIFYVAAGSLGLSGSDMRGTYTADPTGADAIRSGSIAFIANSGGDWKLQVRATNTATVSETITFNFTENNKNYIRKAFKTNPTLTNGTVSTVSSSYWLGETYDRNLADLNDGSGIGSGDFGILLALQSGSSYAHSDQLRDATKAETPFIISQDLAGNKETFTYQKLFRFRTLDAGEWEAKNLKISIADVKASGDALNPYGTFTVEVRLANDSDSAKDVVERFSQCDLNPNSNNYIAKRIGDMYVTWDYTERRYREYGNHRNQSRYIYVDMNSDVDDAATNESYLPFGWEGPMRWNTATLWSGSQVNFHPGAGADTWKGPSLVSGGLPDQVTPEAIPEFGGGCAWFGPPTVKGTDSGIATTASLEFPKFALRANSTEGNLSSPKDAYFGLTTAVRGGTRFDQSYKDLVRPIGNYNVTNIGQTDQAMKRSYIFTMEDLTYLSNSVDATGSTDDQANFHSTASSDIYYFSGSRAQGRSYSLTGTNTWNNILTQGFDSFTVPLWGGFDGLNVRELEPFRNSQWSTAANTSEVGSYAFNSIKVAIDSCADPELVECNLMSVPGIIKTGITDHVIKVCEDRADSLAVIDIAGGYTPSSENTDSEEDRKGVVSTAVSNLEDRNINSSYACCYYPWVQVRDSDTGKTFWCPPSVAAIGTFSSAQRKSEVWFAPAGFTRGGLTEGAAGIPVVNVRQRLTSRQRDQLYEVNINPIAAFPAEGIVVFGQKTLQATPSALDRVNVRRLMIHLKKEISFIASRLLFDQNVQTTWDRFTGQVVPFLDSVKARLGLTDYRVILDETTTTPDLIDRNIMYAKIYLKPARAIEFIAIDFIITSTGASFGD